MIPEHWLGRKAVVVVAHPDDEVLGCAALMTRLDDVRIIHVTDGAPRSDVEDRQGFPDCAAYAAARRSEAEAALLIAGIEPSRLTSLAIPDQEVSLNLAFAASALADLLSGVDLVLTHAFEGGHSDHDGVAFATHAAVRLGRAGEAELVEMPFYYADATGWVRQRFLPQPGAGPEMVRTLTAEDRSLKSRMMAAHQTQADTLASFAVDCERFRLAPRYDFAVRPHGGPLLYERHGWNLSWPEWRERLAAARAELNARGTPCP